MELKLPDQQKRQTFYELRKQADDLGLDMSQINASFSIVWSNKQVYLKIIWPRKQIILTLDLKLADLQVAYEGLIC